MAKRTNDERDQVIDELLARVAALEAQGRKDRRKDEKERRKDRRQEREPDSLQTSSFKMRQPVEVVRGRQGKMVRRVVNPR